MNKAPASLQQLTVVGAVALAHAAGLWALLDRAQRPADAAPAQQTVMVMLLGEPPAALAAPRAEPPQPPQPRPRAAPPVPPERKRSPPPPPEPLVAAVPAPTIEPAPAQPPPPSTEAAPAATLLAAAPAINPEGRAAASWPVTRAASAPPALRRIEAADYLRAPVLEYPSASRRFGEQGRVVLRVLIGTDGHAEKIELHEASAFQRLNDAAIEAARQALYKPYAEDGVAQRAWVLVALSFQLQR
ncbi:MAG TPA: energy transducer TonB [Burkholderiaceae bacterium]|jgi:protein TonB|nr:energy transducer TonB [Burkholderiaceae bacterium]